MSEKGIEHMPFRYMQMNLLFKNLPKDHEQYQAQQDTQNLVVGGALAGLVVGFGFGLLVGLVL